MLDKLDKFHQSKLGYAVFALVGLALAYLFITWAIDGGSWFDYFLSLVFLVVFLQNSIKLIGVFLYGKRRATRR